MSGSARIDVHGMTHQGLVRSSNQDAFLVARLHRSGEVLGCSFDDPDELLRDGRADAYLMIVADGVGGHADGARASGTAVRTIAEHINTAARCYFGHGEEAEHELIEQFELAIARAQEKLLEMQEAEERAPATTLTMAVLIDSRAYVIHVGDSRLYTLHRGQLRQVTRDQTLVDSLVEAGRMSEEQAKSSRMRHVLSRAIGSENATPTVGLVDVDPGDVILICSDGLTRHVDDEALRTMLAREAPASEVCDQLVQAALGGGGRDNIAVIVARIVD